MFDNDTENKFLASIGCWFNVDTIDLRNKQELLDRAGICAADLANKGVDRTSLRNVIEHYFDNWGPAIIGRLIDATDVDWSFNDDTEMQLKQIISKVGVDSERV